MSTYKFFKLAFSELLRGRKGKEGEERVRKEKKVGIERKEG